MDILGTFKRISVTMPCRMAVVLMLTASLTLLSQEVDAQQTVTKSKKSRHYFKAPYWEGFLLRQKGECDKAVKKLHPIAEQGHGFENAQVELGLCLMEMAGLFPTQTPPARQILQAKKTFRQGRQWILTAAEAGSFEAQATMVSLYAANLGPDENDENAAMWTHLYLTNPLRLHLGIPVGDDRLLRDMRGKLSTEAWLAGKEMARLWIPKYAAPKSKVPK